MKRMLMKVAACSLIVVTSCTSKELIETENNVEFKLEVNVGAESRTYSSEDGKRSFWGDRDQIFVSSVDGNSYGTLSLISTSGNKAYFGGQVTGKIEDLKYTIYPVPEGDEVLMDNIDGNNHNAPMFGSINGGSANFNYASGLVRLVVDGTRSLEVKATNGDQKVVTGGHYTYTVDEDGKVTMTFVPNETEGTTIVNLPNTGKHVIFVPIAITEPVNTQDQNDEKEITLEVKPEGGTTFTNLGTVNVEKEYTSVTGIPNISVDEEGEVTKLTPINSPETLEVALRDETINAITLAAPITISKTIEISRNLILDLGGFALEGTENLATAIKVTAGEFTLKNGGLEVYGEGIHIDGMDKTDPIIVNVEEGTGVISGNDCSIYVKGTNGEHKYADVTINTEGYIESKSAEYAAIQANGNTENLTLNVNGGRIISQNTAAIYFPCTTNLNISDGNVEGYSAVYQKSGNLSISGEKTYLIGFGEKRDYQYNGNGCTETGDALIVENCDYPGGAPNISITGGNFVSKYGKNIGSYAKEGCVPITGFVHGGHFSDPTAAYHMADDADIDIHLEKNYTGPGFKTKRNSSQKVRLGFNPGVVYTVTAPLVGSAGTETLGFQFNQETEVILEGDGTITSTEAKMLINNYSGLTMRGVTLAPTAIPDMKKKDSNELQPYYVLSNNCGTVLLSHVTITAPTTAVQGQVVFAMDVCKYSAYPQVHVTVTEGSKINGDIEYTGEGEDQTLTINGSTINGNLVTKNESAAKAAIKLTNGAVVNGSGWNILND